MWSRPWILEMSRVFTRTKSPPPYPASRPFTSCLERLRACAQPGNWEGLREIRLFGSGILLWGDAIPFSACGLPLVDKAPLTAEANGRGSLVPEVLGVYLSKPIKIVFGFFKGKFNFQFPPQLSAWLWSFQPKCQCLNRFRTRMTVFGEWHRTCSSVWERLIFWDSKGGSPARCFLNCKFQNPPWRFGLKQERIAIPGSRCKLKLVTKKPWLHFCMVRAINGFCRCTSAKDGGLTGSRKLKLPSFPAICFADSTCNIGFPFSPHLAFF